MCENNDKKTSNIPTFVENFEEINEKYSELREKIPLITLLSSIEETNKMNSTELRLRRWFKCTKFDEKCFATRNSCQQFLSHLTDKHFGQQLFCIYCHSINDDNKQFYKHEDLIEHIRSAHSYRQFQCNLCLYRSISVDHLLIHQSSVHSRNFEATVNQTSDKGFKECKIIECTQLTETPKPDIDYYFNTFKDKRINEELSTYQCVYCNYLDTNKEELFAHSVAAHPDYPILFYSGINDRDSGYDNSDTTDSQPNKRKTTKRTFDETARETDVTTNGVIDTYEFDIWTESEDEDIAHILTEDDFSSEGEPELKRSRSEESCVSCEEPIASSSKANDNSILHLSQTQLCVAVCVSALLAVCLSVVLFTR